MACSYQTNGACHYYKKEACPGDQTCGGRQWKLDSGDFYNLRWDCGSGFLDPLYEKAVYCTYVPDDAIFSNIQQRACGPREMVPRLDIKRNPITCPAKPCVGKGSAVAPPAGT